MRIRLLSCAVLYREMCAAASASPNIVDVEFLPQGLHNIGAVPMRDRLQSAVDATDAARYDAVALGYGLCNNGLAGLEARDVPLVLPRAHDCITLFLGDRNRYLNHFNSNPGTYYLTTGWLERCDNPDELEQLSLRKQYGMGQEYEELVARYGEDNAKYLYETLSNETRNYRQITFIEMGVEPDDTCERQSQSHAAERGWAFEKVKGDMSLLRRLVDGRWEGDDFVVVPPGHRIVARYDDGIVAVEPAASESLSGGRVG